MDEAIEALLAARNFLYSYLSRAFAAEPDEAFLEIVKSDYTYDMWTLLDGRGGEAEKLQRALAVLAEKPFALAELRSEYTRLFVGPDQLPAPPWESIYVSGEALLFQKSTLAVRDAYRASGFRAAGYPREADDHIATELNFMAVLAERAYRAYGSCEHGALLDSLDAHERFLGHHTALWLGAFAERLEACGVSEFYASFAALSVLFCTHESEVLKELQDSV